MEAKTQSVSTNQSISHEVPYSYAIIIADILLRTIFLYLYLTGTINLLVFWICQVAGVSFPIFTFVFQREIKWMRKIDKEELFGAEDNFEVKGNTFSKIFSFFVVVSWTIISWKLFVPLDLWLKILLTTLIFFLYGIYVIYIYFFSKSFSRFLKSDTQSTKDDLLFIWTIPEAEMKNIFLNKNFENIWGRENGSNKFRLFLMIYSNEASIWYGDSVQKDYYHCKLNRFIQSDGNYADEIPRGVYEFEIVNIPQLDFSHKTNLKHIGEKFYMDRKRFDDLFVIPLYLEDAYDNQLKNTIGLEQTNFK